MTDANNHTVSYAYDSHESADHNHGSAWRHDVYGYDSGGNQQTVTDGLSHTATTLYDALNRATTMISAISGTTTIAYDAAGSRDQLDRPGRKPNPVGLRCER